MSTLSAGSGGDDDGSWPTAAGQGTVRCTAARARAIFDAAPRTELADAAEFLQALLRLPASPDAEAAPGRTR